MKNIIIIPYLEVGSARPKSSSKREDKRPEFEKTGAEAIKFSTEVNEPGLGTKDFAVSNKRSQEEYIMADSSDSDFELFDIPPQNFVFQDQTTTTTTINPNDLSSNPLSGKTISIKNLLTSTKNGLVKHGSFLNQDETSINTEKENTYNFLVSAKDSSKKATKINGIKRPMTAMNYKAAVGGDRDQEEEAGREETHLVNEEKIKNDVEDLVEKIQKKKRIASARVRASGSALPQNETSATPFGPDSELHKRYLVSHIKYNKKTIQLGKSPLRTFYV
jgi:hypothetical protein